MELSEMVSEARSILHELEDGADELTAKFGTESSDRDCASLWALWNACRIYDDDVVALCSAGRYWSALAILRALIDGTAKFSYLLSSLDRKERERRFSCFCEYEREKDVGSIEQPAKKLVEDGEYGDGDRAEFAKGHLIKQIDAEKTPCGLGKRNRDASNELSYKSITGKIAEEFPIWKMFKTHMDDRRARANGFSHLNYLACEDIVRTELGKIENPAQDVEACMAIHLTEVCVLKRIRSEALLHAVGISDRRYCEIMKRHKHFWSACTALADDKVDQVVAKSAMEDDK